MPRTNHMKHAITMTVALSLLGCGESSTQSHTQLPPSNGKGDTAGQHTCEKLDVALISGAEPCDAARWIWDGTACVDRSGLCQCVGTEDDCNELQIFGTEQDCQAAFATCIASEPTECDPSQYSARGVAYSAWLVSCGPDDGQKNFERLQEMEHATHTSCPHGYRLMGDWFETKDAALTAKSCDDDCLYSPTYSIWVDRRDECDGWENFQIFQVVPPGAMPPFVPDLACPDLYMSEATGLFYASEADAPCPKQSE